MVGVWVCSVGECTAVTWQSAVLSRKTDGTVSPWLSI